MVDAFSHADVVGIERAPDGRLEAEANGQGHRTFRSRFTVYQPSVARVSN